MSSEIRKVIENSHLFSGLDPGVILEIATTASKKSFGSHQYLFQKGDTADALWGVLSGRIDIQVSTDDGKEMVLDTFKPGDVFGEVGVLDFGPRRGDGLAHRLVLPHPQAGPASWPAGWTSYTGLCPLMLRWNHVNRNTAMKRPESRVPGCFADAEENACAQGGTIRCLSR